MADMLKITSMVNPKNYSMPSKPLAQSDAIFNLSDLTKVLKTNDRTSEFRQTDNSFDGNNANSLLDIGLKIAKNPSFSTNLLKELFGENFVAQIQESGSPDVINEFNEFSKNLFLSDKSILNDLISQQNGTTSFNTELFDLLRTIVTQTQSDEVKTAIASFLKNTFSLQSQDEVLKSLSNNFKFLSDAMYPSRSLSEQLNEMSKLLSSKNAANNFAELKTEALKLLNTVSNSLIATDKIKNMVSLIKYNFSRFNDNPFSINESFKTMLNSFSNDNLKELLTQSFEKFVQGSSLPPHAKALLLSESESFSNADKLTFALANEANETAKNLNIDKLNSKIQTLATQFAEIISKNQNISIKEGATSLEKLLKLILPQNSEQNATDLMNVFTQTKDLNSLIDRLSYILNSIENVDVKTALAQSMNSVLTELSHSTDIVYQAPTSMENLVDFLSKAINNENIAHLGIVDPDSIVQSMLTAPGVFTPLLHYILPVQIEDMRAFGELWIDNDASENTENSDENSNHLFLSFDIESIGMFELEIFSKNSNLNISLFCPKPFAKHFSALKGRIDTIASRAGYTVQKSRISPLVKSRSLVDIFPRIAERRAGLDVKI